MTDIIVLACIAVAVIILILVGLAAICWLIQRLVDEEATEEPEPMSDFDPKFGKRGPRE